MGYDPILRPRDRARQGGQAIIMVTLALIAMCGLLGLAVDFGWAYFVKRAAQSAADSAAIAAAEEMRRMVGGSGPYPCLNGGTCRDDSAPYDCTSSVVSVTTDNLDNACLYAKDNGFISSGRQSVKVTEGSNSEPPTLSGVSLQYWVTVRVSETVPQLFAAITGNPYATVSARATGGIYQSTITGSIILTNRENDTAEWAGGGATGTNLEVSGNANVSTPGGGILMSSACNGVNCSGYAGSIQGNQATVTADYTTIRGAGSVSISGSNQARWSATPTNGGLDTASEFLDPLRKKTNPPVATVSGDCYIDGGVIAPATQGGTVELGPGNYYATVVNNKTGVRTATGAPIRISGNVNFRAGGSCLNGGVSNPSGFGTYVIYGGMVTQNGQGPTTLNLESGMVVMAGATPQGNGNNAAATPLFDMSVGGAAFALNGAGPTAAGNLFVFTDPRYAPLVQSGSQNAMQYMDSTTLTNLKQGVGGFKSGNNQSVSFTLDGLRQGGAGFPASLNGFNELVMWQDRRNSSVMYKPDSGEFDCVAPFVNCTKSSAQMDADGVVSGSRELFIAAGANTVIRGAIYQPRGAWTTLGGSGGMTSALQLMTGALKVAAGGSVNLNTVTEGVPITRVALVE